MIHQLLPTSETAFGSCTFHQLASEITYQNLKDHVQAGSILFPHSQQKCEASLTYERLDAAAVGCSQPRM
jgi:hypothetical protein